MRLQDIYIYPVKSLGGIKQMNSRAFQRGFEYDRRWMLVDITGKFISQRTEPKLALLQTEVIKEEIFIFNKNDPEQRTAIKINQQISDTNIETSVWDDHVLATHISEESDVWFSSYLGKSCKLVFIPETGKRAVDENYADNKEQVSFADAFPYLLISQASLDDLNSHLPVPILMNRFRPNLVVSGTKAFEEDTWSKIKIGEVYFKVAKPCARCIVTTVDQQTGIKGKEPLNTLSTYRTVNNKILFGQNLIALNEGSVKVNDVVEIIR